MGNNPWIPLAGKLPVRLFVPATDIKPLVQLLNAIAAADGGEPITEADVRDGLAWPGHDPARDRWVVPIATAASAFAAHGFLVMGPAAEGADVVVAVHPAWRRRGIGTALLGNIGDAARDRGARYLAAYAGEADGRACGFLAATGFRPVSQFTTLHLPADAQLPEPVWPPGYHVRSYDAILDLRTYAEAANRSFVGLWGHRDVSEVDIAAFLQRTTPRLDGTFLLFGPAGEVAGFCRAELSDERGARYGEATGQVDGPGITPEHRHLPLRLPLLLTALHWLRTNGQTGIELESFGDAEETQRQYTALGFIVVSRMIGYSRPLVGVETSF